jgi:cell volume regulation protein A
MMAIEYILLVSSILLLLSILGSKASGWLGIPALLLFLLIGMLAGSEGPGGIYFDNPWLAQATGTVALIFILFSGGLDTEWSLVRPVLGKGILLSTIGVFFTAMLIGGFAAAFLGFTLLEGLLLGAIVSSTDAAATFAVLKSRSVRLKGQLEPLLELESGSNDPMAVLLTVGLVSFLVNPATSVMDLVLMFIQQMVVGAVLGYGLGRVMTVVINRLRLSAEGLYPVLTLALVLLIYGATSALGGNGFLAVYLAGLVLGNSDFIHKRSLMRFHDGLAWLMQIAMFLTLGLQVFPSRLLPVLGMGLLASAFLMFVARPVSVLVTLSLTRMNLREKLMVAWVGLRGAVPIILATFPLLAGLPQAGMIFDLVFFIVLTSVLLQGTSLPVVARWLRVDTILPPKTQYPLEYVPAENLDSDLAEVEVPPGAEVVGRQIVDLHLPQTALVVLISRDDGFVLPRGGTILETGDRLLVLADKEGLAQVRSIVTAEKGQSSKMNGQETPRRDDSNQYL